MATCRQCGILLWQAPSAYQGPCSGVMKMGGLSVVGKMDLQTACEVEWPRVDSLVPKSDLLDPKGHHGVAFLGTAVGEEVGVGRANGLAQLAWCDSAAGHGEVRWRRCRGRTRWRAGWGMWL